MAMLPNIKPGVGAPPRQTSDPMLGFQRSSSLPTASRAVHRRALDVRTPAFTRYSSEGHLSRLAPTPLGGLWRFIGAACTGPEQDEHSLLGSRCDRLYGRALQAARSQDFEVGRDAFEELLEEYPGMCKGWVSYAQMVKRCDKFDAHRRWERARQVLQRGMKFNPRSGCLAQAWGLMELQKGNFLGAVKLLERSVSLDPSCSPVLKWQPVRKAKVKMSIQRRMKASR